MTVILHPEKVSGLYSREGAPVPLLGIAYDVRVRGTAVEMTVSQRFRNRETVPLEVTYVFPLPEEAAVAGFSVNLPTGEIEGRVEEREAAFEEYDQAMAEGHGGFLLDQERPNVFHLSIGNLMPGTEAVVTLRLVYEASRFDRGVRLSIPTTVAPRYVPAHFSAKEAAEIERTTPPYAARVAYGVSLSVRAVMPTDIVAVNSPTHPLQVKIVEGEAEVSLAQREAPPDQDLVIIFETAEPAQPGVLLTARGDHEYFRCEFFPDLPLPETPDPRTIFFLVDCSGSMDGTSIDEARRAVELCLRALREGDTFQILRFGSSTQTVFGEPQKLSDETLERAVKLARAMRADLGGTEILPALEVVLKQTGKSRLDLIVLTDGEVGNEAEVLAFARQNRDRVRMFSFGIGAGASEHLVTGLARESAGKSEFVAPGERIEPKVLRLFSRIDTPVLKNIEGDWLKTGVELAPAEIGPLFSGDPLIVSGRAPKGTMPRRGSLKLSAVTVAGPQIWSAKIKVCADDTVVPLAWARRRLRDLEANFGTPAQGSRQKRGKDKRLAELVKVSQEFGLLSSETSFLAIDHRAAEDRAQQPAELRQVPVMITKGWHGVGAVASMPALLRCSSLMPMVEEKSVDTAPAKGLLSRLSESVQDFFTADKKDAGVRSRLEQCESQLSVPGRAPAHRKRTPSESSVGEVPWYLQLLGLQSAKGSLPLTEELAGWAGRSLATLREWAGKMDVDPGTRPDELMATAIALIILETKAAEHADEWRAAADKIRRWLKTRPATMEGRPILDWLRDQGL